MVGGDDVQANFWKRLNNANFGFDCRDNSQNKSLHLIHNEDEEVKFISKYGKYDSKNCFLSLDARIENINKYYDDVDNLKEEEQPYLDILRQEEITKVKGRFVNKKKGRKGKSNLLCHVNHPEEAYSNKAYTFIQDLEKEGVSSMKGVACKKQTTVRVLTRYISSKLIINAKISLARFICDCIDRFCFPNEETYQKYNCNKIIKVLPYLSMTGTDRVNWNL